MRLQKEIKIVLILSLFIIILPRTFIFSQSKIIVEKEDAHKLPQNTIDIIDFNTVVIKEKDQIQIVNISDSSNYEILFSYNLPEGKNYHSIQHGRYIILKDKTTKYYFQSVFDVSTKQLLDLQEPDGSVGAVRVAQKDKVIIYNKRYGEIFYDVNGKRRIQKMEVKLKNFKGETKIIVDSVRGSLWCPNEQWFLASKFLRREGTEVKWERALYNRDGLKVSLPSELTSISQAVWSSDGNYLAIRQSSKLTVIEFEWNKNIPQVKRFISKSHFGSKILFSPDGNYIIYVKSYDDGHRVFGNDIMLTDNTLSFIEPLIEHKEIIEIPISWTTEQNLITQDETSVKFSKNIYKYKIKYK
ncbi:MAG: hypothetical protein IH950_02185 [Bacteroidetes bacterium]|nr:hypothetical protein [Bacteroidota bacterium]